MPKKADIGSKRLVSLDPQAWIRWLLQNPQVRFTEMLDSEFEWVSRQGDVLIRAWDPDMGEFLIANEIQLRYSSQMPQRMRAYAALAEEKFKLPVYRVLVFSEPIPTLLPFVPIMKGGEQEPVIREALRRLQGDPMLNELEPLLAFFS